jgi:hypothetical protein
LVHQGSFQMELDFTTGQWVLLLQIIFQLIKMLDKKKRKRIFVCFLMLLQSLC